MKIALNTLLKNSRIFLVGHEMEIAVICTQKSLSPTKNFFYLGAKAWNILPQSLRASQTVKSFSSAYKNALMENVKNDQNYQINNRFDEFYPIS